MWHCKVYDAKESNDFSTGLVKYRYIMSGHSSDIKKYKPRTDQIFTKTANTDVEVENVIHRTLVQNCFTRVRASKCYKQKEENRSRSQRIFFFNFTM